MSIECTARCRLTLGGDTLNIAAPARATLGAKVLTVYGFDNSRTRIRLPLSVQGNTEAALAQTYSRMVVPGLWEHYTLERASTPDKETEA